MNDITFTILKAVVSVCAALITAYVIPYLKTKLADAKYERLLKIVVTAVEAAEQTFKKAGQGAVKKDDVLVFVTKWMVDHGINITQEQLDRLIEATVFEMNKEKKNGNQRAGN